MPLQGWIASLSVVAALGCNYAELRPAGDAQGRGLAADVARGGVRVGADPLAWRGSLVVQRELVPIELTIENRGTQNLYFSRADVALVGSQHRLVPIAPEQVALAPERVSLGLDPGTPEYLQSEGTAYYYPPEEEQPAAEVRAAAITDGAIAPGQVRRGFVYFERLPKDLARAELHVVLRSAPAAAPVASVEIPFVVER